VCGTGGSGVVGSMSTLLGPEGTVVAACPGGVWTELLAPGPVPWWGGWWSLLRTGRGEVAPLGVAKVRDRRLLENCTVDASIFVQSRSMPCVVSAPLWVGVGRVCDRGFCKSC
jgi:hypothetical protein